MVCKSCERENPQGNTFCGFCGARLDDKVMCPNCEEVVDGKYKYCPHCSSKLSNKKESDLVNKKRPIKNIVFSSITNGVVIILCVLSFLMLFTSVSSLRKSFGTNFDFEVKSNSSIIDYYRAGINGLGKYTGNDFQRDHIYDFENIGLTNIELNKGFILDLFMVDEDGFITTIEIIVIYLVIAILTAIAICIFVLLGFSIYDLAVFKLSDKYKKIFIVIIILGFVLAALLPLTEQKIGIGGVFLIIFSALGLILSYIIDIVSKRRSFKVKSFVLQLITSIFLFVILFTLSSGVVMITINSYDSFNYLNVSQKLNFGSFVNVLDHAGKDGSEYFANAFVTTVHEKPFMIKYSWITYFSLIIPALVLATYGFLITGFISEIKRNVGLNKKRNFSTLFIWLGFGSLVLTVISAIILITSYNNALTVLYPRVDYYLNILPGFIVITILTFMLALYKTIVTPIVNNDLGLI